MLDRLVDIPWGELHAAYGPAEWVPEALWGLLDPDPETRTAALGWIEGGTYHQQTADESTPFVIPFLIEVAAAPSTPGRSRILGLLARLLGSEKLEPVADQDAADRAWAIRVRDAEASPTSAVGFYQEQWRACQAAAWRDVGSLERMLDDPEPKVRIGAGLVAALLVKDGAAAAPPDGPAAVAGRLREALAREANPLARAGHAFALGTAAARVPDARGWLRDVEDAAGLDDPAGLACALRRVDLGEPFDAPALGRFVERSLRLDPHTVRPLPWWAPPGRGLASPGGIEDFLDDRFRRLAGRYPEIVPLVERRTSGGPAPERANALRLAFGRTGAKPEAWPAIQPEPGDDLSGRLAIAALAVRSDPRAGSGWAAPLVAEAFRHPDPAPRLRASWLLRALADAGQAPRASTLAEVVRSERDPAVVANLALALRRTSRNEAPLALELLQEWLAVPDRPRDRPIRQILWKSLEKLARHAPPETMATWLLARIDDPDCTGTNDPDRAEAVALFRTLRLPNRERAAPLGRWLAGDPAPKVRRAVVDAPAHRPEPPDRLPPTDSILRALREDPDAGVRAASAGALAPLLMDIGHDPALAEAIVRSLIEALEGDPDWRVRQEAARQLGLAAPTQEEAQGIRIRQALRHAALGQSAPGSADAVEALVRAAGRDPRHAVRDAAADALQNVEAAVPGLVALLRTAPPHGRAGAADALAAVGEPALTALPDLFRALEGEPDRQVRRRIAHALFYLIPRDDLGPWVEPIARALRDPDPAVRQPITWRIARAGPPAAPLVPELIENLRLDHDSLRRHTLEALANIGSAAEPALPGVQALTRSPSIGVRLLALSAAWAIHGDRPPHVTTLLDALGPLTEDPAPNVRSAARGLLKTIATALPPDHPERDRALALLQAGRPASS